MLGRCVNPFCNRPSRDLERGKLFVIEFPHRVMGELTPQLARREEFWLCEDCARLMTIAVRRDADLNRVSVRIINLPESGATKLKFIPPGLDAFPESEFAYTA